MLPAYLRSLCDKALLTMWQSPFLFFPLSLSLTFSVLFSLSVSLSLSLSWPAFWHDHIMWQVSSIPLSLFLSFSLSLSLSLSLCLSLSLSVSALSLSLMTHSLTWLYYVTSLSLSLFLSLSLSLGDERSFQFDLLIWPFNLKGILATFACVPMAWYKRDGFTGNNWYKLRLLSQPSNTRTNIPKHASGPISWLIPKCKQYKLRPPQRL